MNSRQLTISSYGIASVFTGLCYLGSVRSSAVWLYILPAIGVAALATIAPRKPTAATCLLSGLVSGMVWAVIVNNLSGDNLGPVARSTTVCILGTTLVVTGIRTSDPITSLIGQLLNLSGALFYGAANEVWKLALLAMAFQLAGHICSSQKAQKRQPQVYSWRKYLLLHLLLLVGITTFLAAPLQPIGFLRSDNPMQSLLLTTMDVKPPWNSTLATTTTIGETTTATDDTTTSTSATTTTSATALVLNADLDPDKKWEFNWWIVFLICCLLLLVLIYIATLRVLYVYVLFKRATRRWSNQKVRESIAASWKWTTLVLRAHGFQIPLATSLEQMSDGLGLDHLPVLIQQKCKELAHICNGSAFFRNEPEFEVQLRAWKIAKSIRRDAARKSHWWRRAAFRFVRVLP